MIINRMKKLPDDKREKVLRFVESITESTEDDDREIKLSADELKSIWKEWIETGPQGPIEDEGVPEFP